MSDSSINRFDILLPKDLQAPTVKGCEGFTSLAHLKVASTRGRLFWPILEFPGSLYKSHIKTRLSFPKLPTISLMYCSRWGQMDRSVTLLSPGLGTQPLLWTPGTGSSCLPRYGSLPANAQSQKGVSMTLIPCLLVMARNLPSCFLRLLGSSFHTRYCRKTLILL